MKPYVSENIKEYPRSYMVRCYPHLIIPSTVREFKVEPRLFNTSIGKIFVTPAVAPKTGFGSNTKVIFVDDFEKLINGTDPTLCNIIKTIQPFQLLKYLEQGVLSKKTIKILEKYVAVKEGESIENKEN